MKNILEIARENNVSKTAIVKRIEKLGIKDKLTKQGNRYLISGRYESLILSGLKDTSITTEENQLKTDNPLNAVIEQLSKQLETKDKQIEKLQTMIINLQEDNQTTKRLLQAYQNNERLAIEQNNNPEQEAEQANNQSRGISWIKNIFKGR